MLIANPVLVPGRTTTGAKWKYLRVISTSRSVMSGTTEDRTTPCTLREKDRFWKAMNPWNSSASSSAVRRESVAMRQCSTSSVPS